MNTYKTAPYKAEVFDCQSRWIF